MAGVATEESGAGRSSDGVSSVQQQSQSGEALAEWRSSEQVESGNPSISPPYWDTDDEDGGLKPSELYGKYTWKIDKFSQINKKELRSNAFEVGGYKWYILIYPQGCDVCNHLSLFLCVANHDKLLPGWSHFAQFTIAVVNKEPKKSKYSDTLHRFWKKEHDWGWKKFMELSKVMDGFVDADTLTIKAQVQVIRERMDRPFRCLDVQYRRELVRVYLTNVEQICRRYVEERRGKLGKLIEDKAKWSSFRAFWMGMDQSSRRRMSREKTETVLKVVVKHFFIEKEVTSTLVMDSLYSGLKALEGQNKGRKSKGKYLEAEELPIPLIGAEKDDFVLADDVLLLIERAAMEPLPPKDEKGPQNRTKDGAAGEEFSKDSIERDERRLTEFGRRNIEICVLAIIFSKIEKEYKEAVSLKRQEELIREEEAAGLAEIEKKARRGIADKEKKSKKKQGKNKKNNRKGKDKGRDEKPISIVEAKFEQDSTTVKKKDLTSESESVIGKSEVVEDLSDASDSLEYVPEILPVDSEDREVSPVNWDTDTSEVNPPTEASSCGVSSLSGVTNGREGSPSAVDDSSSTCSSESAPFVMISVPHRGNSRHQKNQKSPSRGAKRQTKATADTAGWVNEKPSQPARPVRDTGRSIHVSRSPKEVETVCQGTSRALLDLVVDGADRHLGKKEEESGLVHRNRNVSGKDDLDSMAVPRGPSKSTPSLAPSKLDSKVNPADAPVTVNRSSSGNPKQANKSVQISKIADSVAALKLDTEKLAASQPTGKPHQVHVGKEKPSSHHAPVKTDKPSIAPAPVVSRPLSAPLSPAPRPAASMVSTAQTTPTLARSVSATGRLGPESIAIAARSYVPQSYRNAIIGSHAAASSSAYAQNYSASSVENATLSYSQATIPPFSPYGANRIDPNPGNPSLLYGIVNQHDMLQSGGPLWMENSHSDVQSFDFYNSVHSRPHDNLLPEFSASSSGRQNHVTTDEFPHLDIINELLDDEIFGPGELGLGLSTGSCRFERVQSHHDDGFQYSYGAPGMYDMFPQDSPQPYVNGQMNDLMANQWQMGGSDSLFLSVGGMDNNGYPYHHIPEFSNLSVGVNGYTVFRPANGL